MITDYIDSTFNIMFRRKAQLIFLISLASEQDLEKKTDEVVLF